MHLLKKTTPASLHTLLPSLQAMSKRANIVAAGIFQPILSLTLMCDSVTLDANDPLMVAIVGPGACILNIDPAPLGLTQPRPTRAQLATMVLCAMECARDSDATRRLPPVCEGIDAVQLVAAFFLWSMEMPFGIYRLITHPLNVSGTRSVESLQQQLPLIKLLCIAHRCIPRSSALWYRPPSPPRRSCPCLTASAGTKACSTAASTRTSAPS